MKITTNLTLITATLLLFCYSGLAQSRAEAAATREFNRLVKLSKALASIPITGYDKQPHRSFLKRNDKDIVYSEPAGQWYVRSNRFWDLRKKYSTLPIADKIAWAAAETPVPGECEGYVPCYISRILMTYGEYLRLYPSGKYSRNALGRISEDLKYMADDAAAEKKNYDGATEAADRVEFVKAINDLRRILSKVPHSKAAKALGQLKVIETGYR